MVQGNHLPRGP